MSNVLTADQATLEAGLADWVPKFGTNALVSRSSDVARTGAWSLRLELDPDADPRAELTGRTGVGASGILVVPSHTYRFTIRHRIGAGAPVAGCAGFMRFYRADGLEVSSSGFAGTFVSGSQTSTSTGWTEYVIERAAPTATPRYLSVEVDAIYDLVADPGGTFSPGQYAYFDDLYLEDRDAPPDDTFAWSVGSIAFGE